MQNRIVLSFFLTSTIGAVYGDSEGSITPVSNIMDTSDPACGRVTGTALPAQAHSK
jgi:hypothetical protein